MGGSTGTTSCSPGDWVVASVNSPFQMTVAETTAWIVRASENPLVDVIDHLSGRKIEKQRPYAFDLDRVLKGCVRTGKMLEINAAPDGRELNQVNARAAAAAGVPIVIDCDAHRVGGFEVARCGVATARSASLTAADVVNTRQLREPQALRPRNRA
jgi:DNA polymerase (family 10)